MPLTCQQQWELNTRRIVIVAVLCFIVFVALRTNGNKIRGFVKDKCEDDKLPDLFHLYLPDCKQYYMYVETFYIMIIVGSVIYSMTQSNICVWYEIVCLLILFSMIKLICSIVTILPDPSGICETKKTLGDCDELMPSGHMATLLIIMFCLWPTMSDQIKVVYILAVSMYAIGILSVKNHYTIDIMMSFFVVYTLYHLVHPYLVNTCHE